VGTLAKPGADVATSVSDHAGRQALERRPVALAAADLEPLHGNTEPCGGGLRGEQIIVCADCFRRRGDLMGELVDVMGR
jgi:hypothetical protein